ncbi:hypothetical protein IFM89_028355 [Coptis chinensis]|uniref:Gnk2-homologous domain-containing protein n=1 Tax=Coptis chinensis TaxID=261450 RepID=A0A835IYC2_9MAGN|nr:hypothetical protein IFM89_028355 [Coptis chinensis]
MAFFLSIHLLLFLLLFNSSTTSPLHPLLALNCTSPEPQSIKINRFTKIILDDLSAKATPTRFATSPTIVQLNHYKGLMQCRLGLSVSDCILCIGTARRAVIRHCPNSEAITAWFDGCCVYYYNHKKISHPIHIAKLSESKPTHAKDLGQFSSALNTLLLQLRASVSLASHQGFYQGDIVYGNGGGKIYAVAECVKSVSAKECETCVAEAINKLYDCCAKQGGVVAAGSCVVQFDSYKFYSLRASNADVSDSAEIRSNVHDSNDTGNRNDIKKKVIWTWCAGVACFAGVVVATWLLRRKIVNTAKVANVREASFDE